MQFLKAKLLQLWHSELVMRVVHTFWQAAGAALVVGLLAAHSTADVKAVLFTAIATGLAAVKGLIQTRQA